jgi:predicted membrane metal-binding protein
MKELKEFLEDHKAHVEAFKEISRWAVLFMASWLIVETLKQLDAVSETATIHVWVFNYVIPIRLLLNIILTFVGRYVDKFLYERNKILPERKQNEGYLGEKGLTGF